MTCWLPMIYRFFVKVDVEGFAKTVFSELIESRHAGSIAEILL